MLCLAGSRTHRGGKFNFAAGSEHSARRSERKRGAWIKESSWLCGSVSGSVGISFSLHCCVLLFY